MEEYVEIPSDSGITFNVQPKMKALEIAEKARDAILSRKFHQVVWGHISMNCFSDSMDIFAHHHHFIYRYELIYQMVTWWVTQVIFKQQLWLARPLMRLLR